MVVKLYKIHIGSRRADVHVGFLQLPNSAIANFIQNLQCRNSGIGNFIYSIDEE